MGSEPRPPASCLTFRTYRIYLNRIADEQRRVAEWTQLHRESTEVLARAIQAKDVAGSMHIERIRCLRGQPRAPPGVVGA